MRESWSQSYNRQALQTGNGLSVGLPLPTSTAHVFYLTHGITLLSPLPCSVVYSELSHSQQTHPAQTVASGRGSLSHFPVLLRVTAHWIRPQEVSETMLVSRRPALHSSPADGQQPEARGTVGSDRGDLTSGPTPGVQRSGDLGKQGHPSSSLARVEYVP